MFKMNAQIAALASVLLLSACGDKGVVGTYDCKHNSRIDQLELTSDGQAIWTFASTQTIDEDYRWEEEKGQIKIYSTKTGNIRPDDWRAQAIANSPKWRFEPRDGNLINLNRESESCTRT